MVLTPAPHRHELDNTIHATFLYTTARLHPFSMQLPAVHEGQSMPEAVLPDNNMDPGSVPAELQGLSQTEEMLIARCCPIMRAPTFSPWAHTSDDSYIYQLSLVLATATAVVSFLAPYARTTRYEEAFFPLENREKKGSLRSCASLQLVIR